MELSCGDHSEVCHTQLRLGPWFSSEGYSHTVVITDTGVVYVYCNYCHCVVIVVMTHNDNSMTTQQCVTYPSECKPGLASSIITNLLL